MKKFIDAKCAICKVALPGVETWRTRLECCDKAACYERLLARRTIFVAAGDRKCTAANCTKTAASGFYHIRTTLFACSRLCQQRSGGQTVLLNCAFSGCGKPFSGHYGKKYCNVDCRDAAYRQRSQSRAGDLLPEFLEYEKVMENHYSRRGIATARGGMLLVFEFLRDSQIKDVCHVTAKVVTEFIKWGRERGLHRSLATHLSFLSVYMDWLIYEGRRSDNPVTRFHRGRVPKCLPRPYSETEMVFIWSLLEKRASTQAKLACAIAEEGGSRITEICCLRLVDVDLIGARLFIRLPNKTMTERWVPFHDKTRKYLEIWMKERDSSLPIDNLLHSQLGKPFNRETLHNLIVGAVCKTKLGKKMNEDGLDKWSTHRLRHTMATRLANNGADFATFMAVGGWVTPESAAGYTDLAQDVVDRGYREAMERASLPVSEPVTVKSSFSKYVNKAETNAA